jgi:RNA polymerase sigma-70 factor, ECF subfamily
MSQMQTITQESMAGDDLVVRARTDAQALGMLYERYYENVFRYCLHRLFVKEVAADVTSSVFLSVATHIRDFGGTTEADFRNWLYAISTQQANAWIRSTKRRRELLEAALSSGRLRADREYQPDAGESDKWSWLYRGIARLKPAHQELISLRFFEGLSYEEIAPILRAKPAGLRVKAARALAKLRGLLEKSQSDERW